ncbi:HAMP domain-containing histidine kinase [Glaciecola sp. MH2013]|uniref:sensor histidine kinase n=1 Tax=Glaciecola sp. MH2013 TaxID=2785524 RepID=UPI0018A011B4|nr:HAMP domain-containing sensor histidine kinase [Glaciecola sp. MH2013]MBF7072730.1 HAMP domain-containing histidine kinase [Glaciecola sp. MH2013]
MLEKVAQYESNEADFTPHDQIDFASVMAVAVHDMKNSLSLLLHNIEQLSEAIPKDQLDSRQGIVDLHYEASRMNTTLVQVLSLYRCDRNSLPLHVDECFLVDLIEELADSNATYTKQKNIAIELDVNEDLSWYLDKDLIFLLLNDVVVNSMRYDASVIRISASVENDCLSIAVEDDGQGYPQSMLDISNAEMSSLSISEGRTGLGLYFARMIAQAHKNNNQHGSIELTNSSVTGGSIFSVKLP